MMYSHQQDTLAYQDRQNGPCGGRFANGLQTARLAVVAKITLAAIAILVPFYPVSGAAQTIAGIESDDLSPASITAFASQTSEVSEDCGRCVNLGGSDHWHRAYRYWWQTPGREGVTSGEDGWHRKMKLDGCEEMHPESCVVESQMASGQQLTGEIAQAVATRDVVKLAALVRTPAIALLPTRRAIQIVGCDGETIVGHVPVSDDLFAVVTLMAAE